MYCRILVQERKRPGVDDVAVFVLFFVLLSCVSILDTMNVSRERVCFFFGVRYCNVLYFVL